MQKDITETQTICDFCEGDHVACHQCLVGKEDICLEHLLSLTVHIGHQAPGFSVYLCPIHAQMLLPFLRTLAEVKGTWSQIGHNPEYNEARLKEILYFLEHPHHPESVKR